MTEPPHPSLSSCINDISRLLEQNTVVLSNAYRRSRFDDNQWVSYLTSYVHQLFNRWRSAFIVSRPPSAILQSHRYLLQKSFATMIHVLVVGRQELLLANNEPRKKLSRRCRAYLWKMIELAECGEGILGDFFDPLISELSLFKIQSSVDSVQFSSRHVQSQLEYLLIQPWSSMDEEMWMDFEFAASYLAIIITDRNLPQGGCIESQRACESLREKFMLLLDSAHHHMTAGDTERLKLLVKALIAFVRILGAYNLVITMGCSFKLVELLGRMARLEQLRFCRDLRRLSAEVAKWAAVLISPLLRAGIADESVIFWIRNLLGVYSELAFGSRGVVFKTDEAETGYFHSIFEMIVEKLLPQLRNSSSMCNLGVAISLFICSDGDRRSRKLDCLAECLLDIEESDSANFITGKLLKFTITYAFAYPERERRVTENLLICFQRIFKMRCQINFDPLLNRLMDRKLLDDMIKSTNYSSAYRIYADLMFSLILFRASLIEDVRKNYHFIPLILQTACKLNLLPDSNGKTLDILFLLRVFTAFNQNSLLRLELFADENHIRFLLRQLSSAIGENKLECELFFHFIKTFMSESHAVLYNHSPYLSLFAYWILSPWAEENIKNQIMNDLFQKFNSNFSYVDCIISALMEILHVNPAGKELEDSINFWICKIISVFRDLAAKDGVSDELNMHDCNVTTLFDAEALDKMMQLARKIALNAFLTDRQDHRNQHNHPMLETLVSAARLGEPKSPLLADLTIKLNIEGDVVCFPSSRLRLSEVSPVFRAMLSGPFAESGAQQIELDDMVDPDALRLFLFYAHTGKTPVELLEIQFPSKTEFTFSAVKRRGEPDGAHFMDSARINVVISLIRLTDKFMVENLQLSCFQWILQLFDSNLLHVCRDGIELYRCLISIMTEDNMLLTAVSRLRMLLIKRLPFILDKTDQELLESIMRVSE